MEIISLYSSLVPKKDMTESSNNRILIVGLTLYASSVTMNIIQSRMESFIKRDNPVEQAGFMNRKNKGSNCQTVMNSKTFRNISPNFIFVS